MYRVLIAQPRYSSQTNCDSMMAAMIGASEREDIEADFHTYGSSALTMTFNVLWTRALNSMKKGQYTHFAMLHNDIVPQTRWLDILMGVMESRRDDLVSVAMPIKDSRGVTSCGLGVPNDIYDIRRFTVRELFSKLPETFGQAETEGYGINPEKWPLVFNTGLWLADLRNIKWYEVNADGTAKFFFRTTETVRLEENSELKPYFEPEDWNFSRSCAREGIRYSVTRAVKAKHCGEADYRNDAPWGTQEIDETWRKKQCVS